jgi:hypothetical protein
MVDKAWIGSPVLSSQGTVIGRPLQVRIPCSASAVKPSLSWPMCAAKCLGQSRHTGHVGT